MTWGAVRRKGKYWTVLTRNFFFELNQSFIEKKNNFLQYVKANKERELCGDNVVKSSYIPVPIAKTFPLAHFWKDMIDAKESHFWRKSLKQIVTFWAKVNWQKKQIGILRVHLKHQELIIFSNFDPVFYHFAISVYTFQNFFFFNCTWNL